MRTIIDPESPPLDLIRLAYFTRNVDVPEGANDSSGRT
jgi:hypothetical protein